MRLTNSIEQMQADISQLEQSGSASHQELAEKHFRLAVAYLRKEENAPAIEHLRQTVSLDPAMAIAQAYLGAALLEEYQIDAAQEALEKALELAPDEMLVQLKMGEFKFRLGLYPEAVKHLELAARLQAPNEATAKYLANLLEKARRFNKNILPRNPVTPNLKKLGSFISRFGPQSKNTTVTSTEQPT